MAHSRREPSSRGASGSARHGFGRPARGRREDRDSFGERRFSRDDGRGRPRGDGERRRTGEARNDRSSRDEARAWRDDPRGFSDDRRRDRFGDRRGSRRNSADSGHRPSGRDARRREWDERGERDRSRADAGRARRDGAQRRDSRPPQRARVPEPPVPEDVKPQDLEASARRELRALGRANAENVARHLIMLQRLLDTDPELAHQHARYVASHAGRVAVVRESAGIAAYLSGHYQEALRDIRAARRLSGLDLHRAIEADCERALGNLDRALKAAQGADPAQLDDQEEAEIAMVVSGVRHEMGQTELGLVVIEEAILMFRGDRETLRRLHSVRADRLEELGRVEEAEAVRVRIGEGPQEVEEEIEVYDVAQEADEEPEGPEGPDDEESGEPVGGAHDPDGADGPGNAADPGDRSADSADAADDVENAEEPRATRPADEEE